jgi:hypothetical protein
VHDASQPLVAILALRAWLAAAACLLASKRLARGSLPGQLPDRRKIVRVHFAGDRDCDFYSNKRSDNGNTAARILALMESRGV